MWKEVEVCLIHWFLSIYDATKHMVKSFPVYLLPYITILCYQNVNFLFLYLNVSYDSNMNDAVAVMYYLSEIKKLDSYW